ncbi:6-phosphofructokinase [Fennellomyces sp. T-0311]|nr:6-phosphofructokinase [Fennellomyces sp. T-0311]
MPKGFAHIVLHASTPEDFESTANFYTTLGFTRLVDENDTDDERRVWLKLDAKDALTTDITYKLTLTPSARVNAEPAANTDWSLEETGVVLPTDDIDLITQKLESIGAPFQKKYIHHSHRVYALDPLENLVVFTDNPTHPAGSQKPETATEPLDKDAQPATRTRRIGVLTSGGDAPGMNPVVRAVVRYGISKGCDVFAIYEGYQEREGRLSAAENLVKRGIDALIVCGGDGSLTGADVFRSEWGGLVEELKTSGRISEEEAQTYQHLTIVGLVGSIDNDMSSTDITIGAVTSLHRICESVDSINTTALSHSRAFVIEVMGRHCGWLALMAGIATSADFVFIPERPPPGDDWKNTMCDVIKRHRTLGKRKTVVIVAEGAVDKYLNPIRAKDIKNVLVDELDLDTRVTTLGHTQRGGPAAAFDRILATIQSVEAVEAVLRSTPDTPSPLIGMSSNAVTSGPLMKAVELTHEVATAIGEKNFARAMELRDPQFAEEFDAYNMTTVVDDESIRLPEHQRLRIGIMHVGAPAGGMNAATRAVIRCALNRGHTPIIIYNGFPGLANGACAEMDWISVDGWTSIGGSELGTNRKIPGMDRKGTVDMGKVTYHLQQKNIQALLLVGGFEAFSALVNLEEARGKYPSLCIPICHIPATVSNNVPGTDYSLGSDTSLNSIVESCDAIVQSARSSRRRVFVVEVQGGKTGYLAVEAGLATGANTIYIPEEGISLSRLQSDVKHLMALYLDDDADKSEGRIILRTEGVSDAFTTDVISSILKHEGHELFDSRTAVLGHIQQGGTPSPMDRIRATRLGVRAVEFMELHTAAALNNAHKHKSSSPPIELTTVPESVAVIGISGVDVIFSPVTELKPQTDFKNRKPTSAWWDYHRPLVDLLSGRGLFTPQARRLREE